MRRSQKGIIYGTLAYSVVKAKWGFLQLYTADDGSKQAHHSQKLLSAQVLHNVFFTHVRDGIEDCPEKDHDVTDQYVTPCRKTNHRKGTLSGLLPRGLCGSRSRKIKIFMEGETWCLEFKDSPSSHFLAQLCCDRETNGLEDMVTQAVMRGLRNEFLNSMRN